MSEEIRVLDKDIFAVPLFSFLHSVKIPFIKLETAGELLLNQSGNPNLSSCSLGAHFSTTMLSFHQVSYCNLLFVRIRHLFIHNSKTCPSAFRRKTAVPVFSGKTEQRNKKTWPSAKLSGTRTLSWLITIFPLTNQNKMTASWLLRGHTSLKDAMIQMVFFFFYVKT